MAEPKALTVQRKQVEEAKKAVEALETQKRAKFEALERVHNQQVYFFNRKNQLQEELRKNLKDWKQADMDNSSTKSEINDLTYQIYGATQRLERAKADLETMTENIKKERLAMAANNRISMLEPPKENPNLKPRLAFLPVADSPNVPPQVPTNIVSQVPTTFTGAATLSVTPNPKVTKIPNPTQISSPNLPAIVAEPAQNLMIDLTEASSKEKRKENDGAQKKGFGIVYDVRMQGHNTSETITDKLGRKVISQGIFEKPERVKLIFEYLNNGKFLQRENVVRIPSRAATDAEKLLVHTKSYLMRLEDHFKSGKPFTLESDESKENADMFFNAQTAESVTLAAGCSAALADAYISGQITCGMAIVRPPGHHAKSYHEGGFCFINNAAICAVKLTQAKKKVLVVDFDVHLGDGTIDILNTTQKDNSLIRYFSIHRWQDEFFPFVKEGAPTATFDNRIDLVTFDTSDGRAKNNKFISEKFTEYFNRQIRTWIPDVVVVSAGFDMAVGDIGECSVTARGFGEMIDILYHYCPHLLLILEGGYNIAVTDPNNIGKCVLKTLDTLYKLQQNKV